MCALDGASVCSEWTGLAEGHSLTSHFPSLRLLFWVGIPENSKVEGPAFTDAIRMYRQSKEQYGTWEMLCGNEVQVKPEGCLGPPWVRLVPGVGFWGATGFGRDGKIRFG